ncbi:MAG: hypothetical protein AAFW70_29520 [Cyanobacteria bacterium J06635_10]
MPIYGPDSITFEGVTGEHPIVSIKHTRACAQKFLDSDFYVVPGMGHGTRLWGPNFVDRVRYFLVTQLEDWRG